MMRFALAMTAIVTVLIVITTLSSAGGHGNGALPFSDKVAHALAFGILVLPLGWVIPRQALWIGLGALTFGGLIEVIQPHFGRSSEWADLLADGIGILIGLLPGVLRLAAGRTAQEH